MRKLFSLFLASLLLAGCSNAPKSEPTPTATPEPTAEATPEVIKNITEGYMQVERDGECYWDENGNFIHNHPIDLDNYIIDDTWAYKANTIDGICNNLETNLTGIQHYIDNNGEIEDFQLEKGTYKPQIVNQVKDSCPTRYKNTLNQLSEN